MVTTRVAPAVILLVKPHSGFCECIGKEKSFLLNEFINVNFVGSITLTWLKSDRQLNLLAIFLAKFIDISESTQIIADVC